MSLCAEMKYLCLPHLHRQANTYTRGGNRLLDAVRLLLQDAACVLQWCGLSLVSSAPKK